MFPNKMQGPFTQTLNGLFSKYKVYFWSKGLCSMKSLSLRMLSALGNSCWSPKVAAVTIEVLSWVWHSQLDDLMAQFTYMVLFKVILLLWVGSWSQSYWATNKWNLHSWTLKIAIIIFRVKKKQKTLLKTSDQNFKCRSFILWL